MANDEYIYRFFRYCVWLSSRIPNFVEMHDYLSLPENKIVMCIDEANNLFDLKGNLQQLSHPQQLIFIIGFQTSENKHTSLAHPFLYGVFLELQQPCVIAGTRICLQQLEIVCYYYFPCF